METDTDYEALWVEASRQHKDANERLWKAQHESADAALRKLVFAAAHHGVAVLTLEASDQGPYMDVNDYVDAQGNELDEDITDDLWAACDLSDHHDAAWAETPGVSAAFRRSGTTATIDIAVAAKALATALVEPLLIEDEAGDTLFTGDLAAGRALAERDRFAYVELDSLSVRVLLCDSEDPKDVAEWGAGPSEDTAWRYALGALFGPIDDDYDEAALRRELDAVLTATREATVDEQSERPHDYGYYEEN